MARIKVLLNHLQLQKDLNQLIFWSQQNNMELNGNKFEVMNYTLNSTFFNRQLPFTSQLYDYFTDNGLVIKSLQTVKDSGVLLSNDNSWTPHIRQMLEVARRLSAWVLSVLGLERRISRLHY